MSEIKNGQLGLYGVEHSKCNRVMTLGFKRLMQCFCVYKTVFIQLLKNLSDAAYTFVMYQ